MNTLYIYCQTYVALCKIKTTFLVVVIIYLIITNQMFFYNIQHTYLQLKITFFYGENNMIVNVKKLSFIEVSFDSSYRFYYYYIIY